MSQTVQLELYSKLSDFFHRLDHHDTTGILGTSCLKFKSRRGGKVMSEISWNFRKITWVSGFEWILFVFYWQRQIRQRFDHPLLQCVQIFCFLSSHFSFSCHKKYLYNTPNFKNIEIVHIVHSELKFLEKFTSAIHSQSHLIPPIIFLMKT